MLYDVQHNSLFVPFFILIESLLLAQSKKNAVIFSFFSLWPHFSLELISKGPFLYFIFRQYSLSFKHINTRTVTV